MFVNFTNHPSRLWSEKQREAAEKSGEIRDIPFPAVPPDWSIQQVAALAHEYAEQILNLHPDAVLCQGEMTMTYQVVSRLLKAGIPVFSACSDRSVEEIRLPDGSMQKTAHFVFVAFREYSD